MDGIAPYALEEQPIEETVPIASIPARHCTGSTYLLVPSSAQRHIGPIVGDLVLPDPS